MDAKKMLYSNNTTYIASSLTCLIAILSVGKLEKNELIFYVSFKNSSPRGMYRSLDSEIKIANEISKSLGLKLKHFKPSDNWIEAIQSKNIIVDLNTLSYYKIRLKQLKKWNPRIVTFAPEHLSVFYPNLFTVNFRALVQRYILYKAYFKPTGVREFISYKNAKSKIFRIRSTTINEEKYANFCTELVNNLIDRNSFTFLADFSDQIKNLSLKKIYIFLPVAPHYGGSSADSKIIEDYIIKDGLNKGDICLLIKNHPSDPTIYSPIPLQINVSVNWHTPLGRTFPAELVGSILPSKTVVLGSGSTALFVPQKYDKLMYYPMDLYGRKLAENNSNHLLRYFKIFNVNS